MSDRWKHGCMEVNCALLPVACDIFARMTPRAYDYHSKFFATLDATNILAAIYLLASLDLFMECGSDGRISKDEVVSNIACICSMSPDELAKHAVAFRAQCKCRVN